MGTVSHRFGDEAGFETLQGHGIGALGHAVVVGGEKGIPVLALRQDPASRLLDARYLPQAAGMADRNRIGGKGGLEVEPRADLDHLAACPA